MCLRVLNYSTSQNILIGVAPKSLEGGPSKGKLICFDGKTLRASFQK